MKYLLLATFNGLNGILVEQNYRWYYHHLSPFIDFLRGDRFSPVWLGVLVNPKIKSRYIVFFKSNRQCSIVSLLPISRREGGYSENSIVLNYSTANYETVLTKNYFHGLTKFVNVTWELFNVCCINCRDIFWTTRLIQHYGSQEYSPS